MRNKRKHQSFDYYHEVSTNDGSSGSPLINNKKYIISLFFIRLFILLITDTMIIIYFSIIFY